jgi:hypothetical protein
VIVGAALVEADIVAAVEDEFAAVSEVSTAEVVAEDPIVRGTSGVTPVVVASASVDDCAGTMGVPREDVSEPQAPRRRHETNPAHSTLSLILTRTTRRPALILNPIRSVPQRSLNRST